MSLKVFCDSCHEYIKTARMDEVSDLKGPVICKKCLDKTSLYLKNIERVAGEAINKINGVLDAARVKFDDARHSIVDAESKET